MYIAVAELGIKGPIEYLQVYATTLVSLLFIYMIPIACKFFLILVTIKDAWCQFGKLINCIYVCYININFVGQSS